MLEAGICPASARPATSRRQSPRQHRSWPGIDCLEGEEMSRKLNFIAALLILSSLCLGGLNALPLHPAPASVHEGGMLAAVEDWMASLFSWGEPHGNVLK